MALLRSRRLEVLLGAPLDAVDAEHIKALVDVGAAEAFDLDYKRAHYGRSDAEKRNLCGDVAALANTAGGLIIIGIAEDDQARAAAAPGVEVTDAEVARIRQIVAGGVSPLPAFDVITVVDSDAPGHGFVLIAVPRSVLAPHAILVNEALRFPARNGATTHYLSEPEVAAAYRARLVSASQRVDRVEAIESDIVGRLDLTDAPWIVITLVPELPGDFAISHASFSEFENAMRAIRLVPLDGGRDPLCRMEVGHQRLWADDSIRLEGPRPYGAAAELHTDGAGALALRMHDIRASVQPADPSSDTLSDEGLAAAIMFGLELLAQHAGERAHASGTAALRATVFPRSTAQATSIGYDRRGFPSVAGRPVAAPAMASTYAPINDLSDGGPELVAVTARACTARSVTASGTRSYPSSRPTGDSSGPTGTTPEGPTSRSGRRFTRSRSTGSPTTRDAKPRHAWCSPTPAQRSRRDEGPDRGRALGTSGSARVRRRLRVCSHATKSRCLVRQHRRDGVAALTAARPARWPRRSGPVPDLRPAESEAGRVVARKRMHHPVLGDRACLRPGDCPRPRLH